MGNSQSAADKEQEAPHAELNQGSNPTEITAPQSIETLSKPESLNPFTPILTHYRPPTALKSDESENETKGDSVQDDSLSRSASSSRHSDCDHNEDNEDADDTIPVIFSWTLQSKPTKEGVFVAGSFNNWKEKIPLKQSASVKGEEYLTVLKLKKGESYRFKFIVNGEWRCSADFETVLDSHGNLVNYLFVPEQENDDPQMVLNNSNADTNYQNEWCSDIPEYLLEASASKQQQKDASVTTSAESRDAYLKSMNDYYGSSAPSSIVSPQRPTGGNQQSLLDAHQPLTLPKQLEQIPSFTKQPDHVTLRHLYALSIKENVIGLSCIRRVRNKYSSVVYYRPLNRRTE